MTLNDEAYQRLRHDFEQLPEAPIELSPAFVQAEAERQAFMHEQRVKDAKQKILILRAQQDPGGYAFDGKHRHLFEVTDSDAEQRLKDDEARSAQQ